MERISVITLAVAAMGLASGLLIDPSLTVISGLALWFLILLIAGGAEDGNPYRTMRGTAMPDFLEVGRFMKQQKVQKEPNVKGRYLWMLILSGAVLVAFGAWMMTSDGV